MEYVVGVCSLVCTRVFLDVWEKAYGRLIGVVGFSLILRVLLTSWLLIMVLL